MKTNWWMLTIGSFAGACAALAAAGLLAALFARPLVKWLVGRIIRRIMKDHYAENVWEMVTAMTRTSPRIVVENSLRAESGAIIERPFGSPRKFLNFDGLMFVPAQLARLPAPEDAPVDVSLTIGPKAKRPLRLDIPLMAGAMGYGVGVSERVKIAMAKGAAAVGTLTNSGEGPLLPEERANGKHYVLQYSSGDWSRKPEVLRQADAIEIHIGQGATAGAASIIPPDYLQGRARDLLGIPDGETLVIPSRHSEIRRPDDLRTLVAQLRSATGGVPIGVKICAGGNLEADLEVAIRAGVDFVSLDGGQAGTKGGAPILEDDFGLPTIYALSRAADYLARRGVKDRITLLAGGGFATPGDCLKALALGADGVYMGTALLWAMTHDQVIKAVPWEPPTELAWYPGKLKEEFDVEKAAHNLANYFFSCMEEIKVAVRALGKTSIRDLTRDDLVALDPFTAKITRVRPAWQPVSADALTAKPPSAALRQPSSAGSAPGRFTAADDVALEKTIPATAQTAHPAKATAAAGAAVPTARWPARNAARCWWDGLPRVLIRRFWSRRV